MSAALNAVRRLERAFARRRLHYRGHDIGCGRILVRTHGGRSLTYQLGAFVQAPGDPQYRGRLRAAAFSLLNSAADWRRDGYKLYARESLEMARQCN